MSHTIYTDKLRAHGITQQVEFTPAEFLVYADQYAAILAEEEAAANQPSTPSDPVALYTNAVQAHLDNVARAKGYDGILSAVTYAEESSVPRFQQEGILFRAWRSNVWANCYTMVAEVQQGLRPAPTVEEVIAALPVITLPN